MKRRPKAKAPQRGKARMRSEIIEAARGLNKIDAVSDADLKKTVLRMHGKAASLD
jgi:hypothetical protein